MPELRITIHAFSGRPNPVLELSGRAVRTAIGLLKPAGTLEKGAPGLPPEPTLGYRGLIVEQLGKPVAGLPRTFRYANGTVFGPRTPTAALDDLTRSERRGVMHDNALRIYRI